MSDYETHEIKPKRLYVTLQGTTGDCELCIETGDGLDEYVWLDRKQVAMLIAVLSGTGLNP